VESERTHWPSYCHDRARGATRAARATR
jgi:hypothetical protein